MKVLDHVDKMLEKGVPSTYLDTSDGLTFSLLTKYHPFVRKFFLEMVSDTPTIKLPPANISLKSINGFLIAEIHFDECNRSLINHFEMLKHEIETGSRSPYYAARIIEMRAFSMDKKRRLIQERILEMIRRFPNYFDYDLFINMQQFFLFFSDEYFRCREVRQVAHTIMSFYNIRKKIILDTERLSKQRVVHIALSMKRLHFPLGIKHSLNLCVGINILRQNEVFKKTHLIEAIRGFYSDVELLSGSEYEREEGIHLINMEVKKESRFTLEEINNLKVWLPRSIKGKIEHLQRTVFMPRNEEEILRHIITLGKELHFARDLPQLILSFEKQTENHLIFNVVLARVILSDTSPIEDILKVKKLRPKIDRVKKLGMIRKKYPKEAAVCKIELPLKDFLREDHAVDLYRARQKILQELQDVFGNLRDYNGGMISKQNETFVSLKKSLGVIAKNHSYLLENYFHSLLPLEKRSFIDSEKVKNFFLLLLEVINSSETTLVKEIDKIRYVISKDTILEKVSSPLISLDIEYDECTYCGYIENIDRLRI